MTSNRRYVYTGLKNFRKPNEICHYKNKVENDPSFNHEVEDGQCYSSICELLSKNPGKDPISVLAKETNKSPQRLYKESMKHLAKLENKTKK